MKSMVSPGDSSKSASRATGMAKLMGLAIDSMFGVRISSRAAPMPFIDP